MFMKKGPMKNPIIHTLYFKESMESQPFVDETFFILLQDGGTITTQTGDNFELQEAP